MKIISHNTGRILTWADFDVEDVKSSNMRFKKMVLTINAGDIVTLEVEEYDDTNCNIYGGVATKTSVYCVDNIFIEATDELEKGIKKQLSNENIEQLKKNRTKNISAIGELEV